MVRGSGHVDAVALRYEVPDAAQLLLHLLKLRLDALQLLKRTGFGEVLGSRHMDAKGIHYSSPNGGYDIHYREDLWEGTQDYSVIHETYEIIYETLCEMESSSPPDRRPNASRRRC